MQVASCRLAEVALDSDPGPARHCDVGSRGLWHPGGVVLTLRGFDRIVAFSAISMAAMTPASGQATGPDPSRVVVLELFTAQGCSSCPPADRVLSRLGLDERIRGQVLPLAFHVDYWNVGGWKDPFSAAAWTARQYSYARALYVGSPYTPQLVVDGQREFNGSREERALSEIKAALDRPSATRVTLAARRETTPRQAVIVDVGAEVVESIDAGRLEVLVALVESGLATDVAGGENGGRTLQNDFIVRSLKTAFTLKPEAGTRGLRTFALTLRTEWRLENLSVAAFVQDTRSMRICGATAPVRLAGL